MSTTIESPSEEHEEFMLEPVPLDARRPAWKQVMVWVGFGYVVTGLFVGGVLAGFGGEPGVPPSLAILAIAIGMGVLCILTTLLGIVAQKTGLNLAMLSRYSYGSYGANLPLAIMALLTLGWFASITGMTGQIWASLIGNPTGVIVFEPAWLGYTEVDPITLEVFLTSSIFGALFTYTAYRGIAAIEKVAIPVAPFVLAIAIFVGVGMLQEGGGLGSFLEKAGKIQGLGLGSAITIVMGSWIAGAVMGVDLFRFNTTVKAVIAGSVACFILTNPLLNLVGYIGAVSVGQFNYVEWMYTKGWLLALIGVLVWTTSLWTTNNAELYCNSLYTGPILASNKIKVKRTKIVLVVGILGTILGALAFYQMFFAAFITILGAAFLPLAGPIIADYYICNRKGYNVKKLHEQPALRWPGIISFLIGAVLGLALEYRFDINLEIPSGIIALIVTTLLYVILYPLFPTKDKED